MGEHAVVVLVVDDDATMASTIARRLRHFGCEVHTAEDGRQALNLAKRLKPRLAVVDQVLGLGIQGVEIVQALRRVSPTTISVILSGHVTDTLHFQAGQAGAIACFDKETPLELLRDIALHGPRPAKPKTLEEMEQELIADALEQEDTVAKAAERLGISARGLEKKVRRWTGQSPRKVRGRRSRKT